VLQDYYSKQKENTAEEKIKLVQAAAKLIMEDIRTSHEEHPMKSTLSVMT